MWGICSAPVTSKALAYMAPAQRAVDLCTCDLSWVMWTWEKHVNRRKKCVNTVHLHTHTRIKNINMPKRHSLWFSPASNLSLSLLCLAGICLNSPFPLFVTDTHPFALSAQTGRPLLFSLQICRWIICHWNTSTEVIVITSSKAVICMELLVCWVYPLSELHLVAMAKSFQPCLLCVTLKRKLTRGFKTTTMTVMLTNVHTAYNTQTIQVQWIQRSRCIKDYKWPFKDHPVGKLAWTVTFITQCKVIAWLPIKYPFQPIPMLNMDITKSNYSKWSKGL